MAFSFCQWLYIRLCARATFLKICSRQCLDLMILGQCGKQRAEPGTRLILYCLLLVPSTDGLQPGSPAKSGIRMIMVRGTGFGFFSKGKRHTIFI
ncbi:hypothetical protein ACRRTK_017787 [Alexandromys fortis]